MGLSVVVITRNEEANIGRCLESVRWADEIILIDSASTDRTVDIARTFGAVVCTTAWRGYGPAKREGVARASQDWILSLDADEAASPELADEVRAVIVDPASAAGYIINRRTNFLGRWIRHSGWYPDPVLRLFRRAAGNFNDAVVHERVEVQGPVGRLTGEILHFSYPTLEHYLGKFDTYTTLGAREAFRRGRRTHWYDLVFRSPVAFIKHYLVKQGFRDGWEGLIISVMSAIAVFVKYAKLRHLQREEPHTPTKDYGTGN